MSGKKSGDRPQCVHIKKDGTRCKNLPEKGKTRCASHKRPGRPIVHGRYSQALKDPELRKKFKEAREDPDLLSLRDSYAIIDTWKLEDLQRALSGKGSDQAWIMALELLKALGSTLPELLEGKLKPFEKAYEDLHGVLTEGVDAVYAKERFVSRTVTQAKLQESETKRAVLTGKVIEMTIVTALFNQVREAILKHVQDPATLRAIETDINFAVVAADEQRALGTGI